MSDELIEVTFIATMEKEYVTVEEAEFYLENNMLYIPPDDGLALTEEDVYGS